MKSFVLNILRACRHLFLTKLHILLNLYKVNLHCLNMVSLWSKTMNIKLSIWTRSQRGEVDSQFKVCYLNIQLSLKGTDIISLLIYMDSPLCNSKDLKYFPFEVPRLRDTSSFRLAKWLQLYAITRS